MVQSLQISERAARRIAEIAVSEQQPALFRVAVDGGGCSGFQYRFEMATEATPDDAHIAKGDVIVLVDSVSEPFLAGAELDYVDELIGAAFKVKNPNATASCGCGTSFSL